MKIRSQNTRRQAAGAGASGICRAWNIRRACVNRDAHRSLFLLAQEGYRKLVIEELDKMLIDARAPVFLSNAR